MCLRNATDDARTSGTIFLIRLDVEIGICVPKRKFISVEKPTYQPNQLGEVMSKHGSAERVGKWPMFDS